MIFKYREKAFTLFELIIVIIIIGILGTLGLTHFGSVRERVLDREAQSNLEVIFAAERIFRMENGGFYPDPAATISTQLPADLTDINSNLNIFLRDGDWRYSMTTTTIAPATQPNSYTAQAERRTGPRSIAGGAGTACIWSFNAITTTNQAAINNNGSC